MRTLALVTALLLAGACGGKAKPTGTTAGSSTVKADDDHDKATDESVKDDDQDDKTDEAAKDKAKGGDKDTDHDDNDDEGPAKK